MSIQTAMKQFDDALSEAQTGKEDAEKAVIHWTEQVAKLTKAKAALAEILSPDDLIPAQVKAKPSKAKAAKASSLPKTDSAFWKSCLTETPQTTKEILDVACAKLGVTDPEAVKTLQARQTSFLQSSAKDGSIKSEGERLNRKYFV